MYRDKWSRSAARTYRALPPKMRTRIDEAVSQICNDPVSAPGVKALTGPLKGKSRKRVGDYRIIFSHDSESLTLNIFVLQHRRDVYR